MMTKIIKLFLQGLFAALILVTLWKWKISGFGEYTGKGGGKLSVADTISIL